MELRAMFSLSGVTSGAMTAVFILYVYLTFSNFYKIMYPLSSIDISAIPEDDFVRAWWEPGSDMEMRVFLSRHNDMRPGFLRLGFAPELGGSTERREGAVLLWKQHVTEAHMSKSFLLTMLDCEKEDCLQDESYKYASTWLDHADHITSEGNAGILSTLSASAGEGIESTSVLLTMYNAISHQIHKVLSVLGLASKDDENEKQSKPERTTVPVPPEMWSTLQSNSSWHVFVLIDRKSEYSTIQYPTTAEETSELIKNASSWFNVIHGQVDLLKYDVPYHVEPPKRILYNDVTYLFQRYITRSVDSSVRPPWDTAYSKPQEHAAYQEALDMKEKGVGYPYWKPEVAVKYVNDDQQYPFDHADIAGMKGKQMTSDTGLNGHLTGWVLMPELHVDEIGLTSEKYIPINETITTLPLRLSVDRSDMEHRERRTTATEGGLSPARWRLLSHLSKSLEAQKELGFEQSDIDELRRLIADTNVTILSITLFASALHLLFEFLTFKSDVSFWRSNKDLTGLSVRSLFLDMMGQVIILLFLIEKDSSLLVTVPTAIGCLIALWKCQRGAGFKFVRKDKSSTKKVSWWNILPGMFGYELRATRLDVKTTDDDKKDEKSNATEAPTSQDLAAISIETDRIATRTLGTFLLPVVLGYVLYSFVYEEHTGWYSWFITSASSAVYALGFVLMTPQLFLNYKLKSVAHLPWRVLGYKFINTFIDDLFAFIIRMPAMTRLSCFRDDIVFFVYLYQRWLYPVDTSRPVEGVGDTGTFTNASSTEVPVIEAKKHEPKKLGPKKKQGKKRAGKEKKQ